MNKLRHIKAIWLSRGHTIWQQQNCKWNKGYISSALSQTLRYNFTFLDVNAITFLEKVTGVFFIFIDTSFSCKQEFFLLSLISLTFSCNYFLLLFCKFLSVQAFSVEMSRPMHSIQWVHHVAIEGASVLQWHSPLPYEMKLVCFFPCWNTVLHIHITFIILRSLFPRYTCWAASYLS